MVLELETIARVDPGGMRDIIGSFPEQLADGIRRGLGMPSDLANATRVFIVGMGGSGIAGEVFAAWVANRSRIPIHPIHDYRLPSYAKPGDLVIAVSYSGNTEETLAATAQGIKLGCRLVAVTSGGALAKLAQEAGAPLVEVPAGLPPRGAFGHLFGILPSLGAEWVYGDLRGALRHAADDPAGLGEADALAARLKSDARIAQVRFVPRDKALKELKTTEGLADVIDALDHNPLPDAFVVRARDSSPETLAELAQELRRAPSVAHVQADAVWAQRLASLARLGRLAVLLLAGLLAFGLVAVTFNTIRLQILTQRDEIEVSKLIGATDAFIRRPFLYLGLLQGLAGGGLALGIVWSGLQLLNGEVRTLAQTYGSNFRFDFLAQGDALAVVLFAGSLGWLAASLSVSRYLLEIQPK